MTTWTTALREGLISGSIASVLSATALAVAGRRQNGSVAAPLNAVSHWAWGRPALRVDHADLPHTVLGYAIHHATSVMWGTLYAKAWAGRARHKPPAVALPGAVAAAAAAAFVDYKLTPERLTPGFEHRLSTGALVAVYACFALGLALGSMAAADGDD